MRYFVEIETDEDTIESYSDLADTIYLIDGVNSVELISTNKM